VPITVLLASLVLAAVTAPSAAQAVGDQSEAAFVRPAAICTVPHVQFDPLQVAVTKISNAGLVAKSLNSGVWVLTQSPSSGTLVTCGSTVNLRLASGPVP
jgi:hypothetical protein